jgi:Flp pilus assembly protein TadD
MIRSALFAAALLLSGCATGTGPYSPQTEAARDTAKAQLLTQRAAAIMDKDPKKAEGILREALTADLYHGPAHNDLGVIYLKRGELFSAASEFEWASRLMPGLPEPRMNLALTLENAGRTDEALSAYATALDVYQGHIPTVQAMTRLQVKSGRTTDHTRSNLEEIALKGQTQQWREWARQQLTRLTP